MNTIFDLLFTKLGNIHLSSFEVSRLFIDVRNIIEHNRIVTNNMVIKELKHLGWDDIVLEPDTLDLVISALEPKELNKNRIAVMH